jgi:peptide/nickel transport system substrate-binding protein
VKSYNILLNQEGGNFVKKKSSIALFASFLAASTVFVGCTLAGQEASAASGGKTLIVGRGGDTVSLDPANVTDGESFRVTRQIYETLLDTKPGSFDIVPGLATSWKPSANGLTWTFHLRKGVKFQDGTPFNADAVVFNFNRWADKKNPYHKGDFEYYGAMFGGYKGDKGTVIKSVRKIDDYTVQIQLTHSFAPFLSDLTMEAFAIASPAAIKKYHGDIKTHPVGTGPFTFVNWKPNDSITLKKNPKYWHKGLPKLDKIVFQVIKDNTARLNALQAGQVDLIDGVNPSDVAAIKNNPNLKLYLRPSNNVGYLALNTQKKPFNDVRVRQAINMAVDKKAIVDAFYSGLGKPAVTPLPPGMWGDNKSIKDYQVNIEKAKELLKEAGYPDGFETDLWAMPVARPYMPEPEKIATAIQADLAKIGIKANIVTYDWATYLDKTARGEHSMALLGWTGDNGDPDDFLYVLLDSDNANPPAQNIAFYKNPKVHQLLKQAQIETNQAKRAKLYQQAEAIIWRDAPWVTLVHTTPPLASSTRVTGFIPNPTGGELLANVDLK